MTTNNKHTFALYCPTLTAGQPPKAENFFECTDHVLWHRIVHILRLTAGEAITLFDGRQEVTIRLSDKTFTGKNKISGVIQSTTASVPLAPAITLMPSLLKREAFEAAAYLAAAMGATTFQPLIAAKTQRSWHTDKEHARLANIMIAACEQAKNFVIPELKPPISVTTVADCHTTVRGVYFEDDGAPLMTIINQFITAPPPTLSLVFGPEGGLTADERRYLDTQGFVCCALTPTILRAQDAVAVGLGSVRSLLKSNT
jgi:16S rRNA (uracil1498-N3)-methyltransferase